MERGNISMILLLHGYACFCCLDVWFAKNPTLKATRLISIWYLLAPLCHLSKLRQTSSWNCENTPGRSSHSRRSRNSEKFLTQIGLPSDKCRQQFEMLFHQIHVSFQKRAKSCLLQLEMSSFQREFYVSFFRTLIFPRKEFPYKI